MKWAGKRKTNIVYSHIYIYGIWKNDTDEPMCRAWVETQMYRMDFWTWRGKENGTNWDSSIDIYMLPCAANRQLAGSCYRVQEAQLSALWRPRGWDGGWEGDSREETHAYTWLIHAVVQQKLTQHSKAIILQSKKKKIIDRELHNLVT